MINFESALKTFHDEVEAFKKTNKKKRRKLNIFVAFQVAAGLALGASGHFAENAGRMTTGIANSTRNGGWLFAHGISRFFAKSGIGKDIAETRANVLGAFLAAATNVPQFMQGLNNSHLINSDLIGGSAAIAAYLLMCGDRIFEQKRLKDFFNTNPDYKDRPYTAFTRDQIVGYKEHDSKLMEAVFNWAPGSFLLGRALTFTADGGSNLYTQLFNKAAQTPLDEKLAAVAMLTAGVLFTVGAVAELREQNSLLRKTLVQIMNGHGNGKAHKEEPAPSSP